MPWCWRCCGGLGPAALAAAVVPVALNHTSSIPPTHVPPPPPMANIPHLLPQDHKDTGASLSALASCLGGQGRYAEAEVRARGRQRVEGEVGLPSPYTGRVAAPVQASAVLCRYGQGVARWLVVWPVARLGA